MEGHNCRDEREDGPCHPERHPDGHKQREVLLHLLHLEGQGLRERLQALAKCAPGSGKGKRRREGDLDSISWPRKKWNVPRLCLGGLDILIPLETHDSGELWAVKRYDKWVFAKRREMKVLCTEKKARELCVVIFAPWMNF